MDVESDSLFVGHIAESEGDDSRYAQFECLAGEIEIALQIGGIGHNDHALRRRHAGHLATKHVDSDLFIGAFGGKAIGARQVDQLDRVAPVRHPPEFLLDRHARIVAHSCRNPCQCREERALASVWIAQEHDCNRTLRNRDAGSI